MEYILEGIDAEMGSQPKVILFDIGGVVVSDERWSLTEFRVPFFSLIYRISYL